MIKFSCFSYALIGVSLFFMMGCSSLAENRSANTSTYRAQQPYWFQQWKWGGVNFDT